MATFISKMPTAFLLLLVPVLFSDQVQSHFESVEQEEKLTRLITSKLTKTHPPVGMQNNSVFVYFDIYQIVDVIEKDGLITVKLWLYAYYILEEPLWNEAEFNNVSIVQFPGETFWVPDVGKVPASMLNNLHVVDVMFFLFCESIWYLNQLSVLFRMLDLKHF